MRNIELTGDPNKTYVPGTGPSSPRIVIVGEAPFHEEIAALKPFVGPSGRFLTGLLADVGINRNDCYITNVCKYFVPASPKKNPIPFIKRAQMVGINIDEEVKNLHLELNSLQPNVVIALGGTALWALTGKTNIQDWRGSILSGIGYKIVPSYHPAHILHQSGESTGYWNKYILEFDLRRAKEESYSKILSLPNRQLNIIRNSGELYEFFRQYPANLNPSIDIEAHSCVPICIGIAYDKSYGITVPLWNVQGISSISNSDLVSCWRLISERLVVSNVIGQNFGYDRDKIKRLGFIINRVKDDTMFKAHCINPELPKNLAFNTSIYTREPFYKNEGMYEGSINDLLLGCARDACVTYEVNEAMDPDLDERGNRKYYENFMLPLQNVYGGIENEGFKLDENIQIELIKKYIEWDEKLRLDLYQLTGKYINCNSHVQVGKLLYEDLSIPAREGTGEEILTTIINRTKDARIKKIVEIILEDRRVRKTLNSYGYALKDFDGRMRTSYFLCLNTGRSSTNMQDPPIRPDIDYVEISEGKKVKKRQSRGMAFQTITKHGDIGNDIRTMLVADEGYIFLQADSSQAEARVIFLLAEDYEALELIDKIDYHAYTTTWFIGGTIEMYDKKHNDGKETPERFLGKTLRHACHLDAKAKRAATEVNTQARKYKIPITIDERKAAVAIESFHNRQPKIRKVFHAQVKQIVEATRTLKMPVPYGIDADCGAVRTFYERMDEDLMRQGLSCIPQWTVSENTKGAALRIKGSEEHGIKGRAPWIRIHVESHDALLTSVPIERKYEAREILIEEMQRPIDFKYCSLERGKLIIPCDIEEGYNYRDLSKFKFHELVNL